MHGQQHKFSTPDKVFLKQSIFYDAENSSSPLQNHVKYV